MGQSQQEEPDVLDHQRKPRRHALALQRLDTGVKRPAGSRSPRTVRRYGFVESKSQGGFSINVTDSVGAGGEISPLVPPQCR